MLLSDEMGICVKVIEYTSKMTRGRVVDFEELRLNLKLPHRLLRKVVQKLILGGVLAKRSKGYMLASSRSTLTYGDICLACGVDDSELEKLIYQAIKDRKIGEDMWSNL
jgi:DNA-binding IscR family transcriptional regulator